MTNRNEHAEPESVDAITDALLTASRLLISISARSIADVDETLTIPQFRTLVILSNRAAVNVATLAVALDVAPSTATRMVDRLVNAGFIDRQPNPHSRRELILDLTDRGQEVVRSVTSRRRAEIAEVVHRMPVGQRSGLVQALASFTTAGGEPAVASKVDGYLV